MVGRPVDFYGSMVLPIHTYGHPVLRAEAEPVEGNNAELQALIDDMIETMRGAQGIGLAAPQVGRSLRLFVVDLTAIAEREDEDTSDWPAQPMVFINPEIEAETEEECAYEEGCLSIPDLREDVTRPEGVRLKYLDRTFAEQEIDAYGILARVVQHEYDHLDGVLFVDLISPFRRKLMQRRLREMAKGDVEADYPLAAVEAGSARSE